MTWLTAGQIPTPQRNSYPTTADFMLAFAVHSDLMNADVNFLSGNMGPQYANPQAYVIAMMAYAQTLTENTFPEPYAPVGWNPATQGFLAAMACLGYLSELPVNAGDPNTLSVLAAWEAGTGMLYGGHLPAAPVTTQSTGNNPATGQSSAPPNTIL